MMTLMTMMMTTMMMMMMMTMLMTITMNDDDAVDICGTDMSILNSPINLKAKLTRKITRHRQM